MAFPSLHGLSLLHGLLPTPHDAPRERDPDGDDTRQPF